MERTCALFLICQRARAARRQLDEASSTASTSRCSGNPSASQQRTLFVPAGGSGLWLAPLDAWSAARIESSRCEIASQTEIESRSETLVVPSAQRDHSPMSPPPLSAKRSKVNFAAGSGDGAASCDDLGMHESQDVDQQSTNRKQKGSSAKLLSALESSRESKPQRSRSARGIPLCFVDEDDSLPPGSYGVLDEDLSATNGSAVGTSSISSSPVRLPPVPNAVRRLLVSDWQECDASSFGVVAVHDFCDVDV